MGAPPGIGVATAAGELIVDRLLGDGHVRLRAESKSNIRWNCDRNDQLRLVCPFRQYNQIIRSFTVRTYVITSGLGYVSQRFDLRLVANYDGCDVSGAFITVSGYDETFFGRKDDFDVSVAAVDSPYTRPSGCLDCCPKCASVAFNVTVSAGSFLRSYLVTFYGDGTRTVQSF
jgi:hypothetical protein